jgi:hypothetical protein
MLEQFAREWMQLYPEARILLGSSEELSRKNGRRRFVARAATADWDAIVITMSAFERIGMTKASQQEYLDREEAEMEEWLRNARDGEGLTVKRLEKALHRFRTKVLDRVEGKPRDPGLCFEGLGVDYLVVDEAHLFKNLRTASGIPDAEITGSQRAEDLAMKLEYLRRRLGRRIATFATATPIANSITEAHVMCRYLRPDVLQAAGVLIFDCWAGTFGKIVTKVELAPEGGESFRMKSRFAEFTCIAQLMQMWFLFADVKMSEDLDLQVPDIAERPDGKRDSEIVVVPPSQELLDYVQHLGERAKDIRDRKVSPEEDNMLKVCGDGRKAAIDMRLVGLEQTTPGKVEAVADKVHEIWSATAGNVYQGSTVRGAFQVVFCDMGTPNARRWNFYDTLRAELVYRGMPASRIRFVHEANNDRKKARLFAACRSGAVSVLLGSTEKMGVGVNVQDRLVALHEADAPWRPADVAQRIGRGIRQGNLNKEVRLLRYVTSRSFDGYMWQGLTRKAIFIGQLIRGKFDTRSVEDIGDTALSFAEVNAIVVDNPLMLEKTEASSALTKLERALVAHDRNQDALAWTLRRHQDEITYQHGLAGRIRDAITIRDRNIPPPGEDGTVPFSMIIGEHTWTERAKATDAFRNLMGEELEDYKRLPIRERQPRTVPVGWLAGFKITCGMAMDLKHGVQVTLALEDVPHASVTTGTSLVWGGHPDIRLQNMLDNLEPDLAKAEALIIKCEREIELARANIGAEFPQLAELSAARRRVAEITAEIDRLANENRAGQADNDTAAVAA